MRTIKEVWVIFRLSLSLLLALSTIVPTYAQSTAIAATEPVPHTQAAPRTTTAQTSASDEHISDLQVETAVAQIEKLAQKQIDENVVPGLAIAVVHKDKMIFAKGFGAREVGKEGKIDADTVFQLASVSKSLASTVVAALVGEGKITWDSKISDLDPSFEMHDSWVTREITIRDFIAHRSGLPDHAGDLLEDLGADRAQVLYRLRFQKPDSSFRSHYAYTNFGFTEGGVAAARAYGLTWEEASEQKLYKPLGMSSTSSRYCDFSARTNRAVNHVLVDDKWVHKYDRQPDAQSPAGGASSSVIDMAKWMRLQIANGKYEGKQIVNEKALDETHHPQMLTQFSPLTKLPGFYGLGMNVNYEHGSLRLGHSGGFSMGAATNFTIVPSEELGIVVLTNAAPIGVAEALANTFMDLAKSGKQTVDWFALFKKVFANPASLGEVVGFDYSKPPVSPTTACKNSAYLGTYTNKFFGDIEVTDRDGALSMVLGPKHLNAALKHYDRDIFTYETEGENAVGISGVTFTVGSDGKATTMLIEHLNDCGEGTFERVPTGK